MVNLSFYRIDICFLLNSFRIHILFLSRYPSAGCSFVWEYFIRNQTSFAQFITFYGISELNLYIGITLS